MSDPFSDALDALVPEPADDGDWSDVVARADARRSLGRRRLLVAGVAAAAIALVAAPAFGLGGALLDLIGRTDVPFRSSRPAPNLVKKQFFDRLGAGRPAGMSPQAIAAETRKVGEFRVGGRRSALWVAPTRGGGYCYVFERAGGSCRIDGADRRRPLGVLFAGRSGRVARIAGDVTAASATKVAVVFADGTTAAVPFVWVSRPIAAGFFAFDVPGAHHDRAKRLEAVIATDARGDVVGATCLRPSRVFLRYVDGHCRPGPRPSATVPARPFRMPAVPTRPVPPLQRGSGDGATVVVGANGFAVFDTGATPASRLPSHGARATFGCFRLTREFGISGVRETSVQGAPGSGTGVYVQARGPFDGCEIGSDAGHRWPDRLAGHDPVEIPLTPAGRRFFADRAAARDLALFVRSRGVQRLRREPPARALRDLRAAYPPLATSSIRIAAGPGTLTFSETSPTGRRFAVVVAAGRIVHRNLEPYAFVF